MTTTPAPDLIVAFALYEKIVAREGEAETRTPGGAALHAALGAFLAGARTALVGRWPDDAFPDLRAALEYRLDLSRLQAVAGSPGRIRIDLDRDGSLVRAVATPGLDAHVTPEEIPEEWRNVRAIIVPSLGGPALQSAFIRKIRAQTEIPLVAAIFEPGAIQTARREAITVIRECDVAFLDLNDLYHLADGEDALEWLVKNARWAVVNLGDAGILLVTAGPGTIRRIPRPRAFESPAEIATIAGAVTASLALGRPVEIALQYGAEAGGLDRALPGPADLLAAEIIVDTSTPATPPLAVVPDFSAIHRAARVLAGTRFSPFTFNNPAELYPPVGHPRAAEFFFTIVLHQYGFWEMENGRWKDSMYGVIDGKRLKGSDFVWRSATKALAANEADLTAFLDDDGHSPLPMLETHRDLSRRFAAFLVKNPPQTILDRAHAATSPLEAFIGIMKEAPGYAEDPFRKKLMLLAMTLANRPERFLRPPEGKELSGWGPVVDYHIQRTSLRAGLVLPIDAELRTKLTARRELSSAEERLVRRATFEAMEELSRLSGLSHAAIDWLFFQARTRCPEINAPDCPNCPLKDACARQIGLFQPVFRTTYY
jgi:sugar/nucleoside kinase (ribokinase family)